MKQFSQKNTLVCRSQSGELLKMYDGQNKLLTQPQRAYKVELSHQVLIFFAFVGLDFTQSLGFVRFIPLEYFNIFFQSVECFQKKNVMNIRSSMSKLH